MNPMDLSAAELAARVRSGEMTPAQVGGAARARVAERNPALNAMTVLNPALEDEAADVAARLQEHTVHRLREDPDATFEG